jgi:hypothetical protein
LAPSTGPSAEPPDPNLARIVVLWPTLPEAARRMILAAVDAAV